MRSVSSQPAENTWRLMFVSRPLEDAVLVPIRLADHEFVARRFEVGDVRPFVGGVANLQHHVDDRLCGQLGTEVEPACSNRTTLVPSTSCTRAASLSYRRGHSGSYSATSILAFNSGGEPT